MVGMQGIYRINVFDNCEKHRESNDMFSIEKTRISIGTIPRILFLSKLYWNTFALFAPRARVCGALFAPLGAWVWFSCKMNSQNDRWMCGLIADILAIKWAVSHLLYGLHGFLLIQNNSVLLDQLFLRCLICVYSRLIKKCLA